MNRDPMVEITIEVPERLAEFINKSIESGRYLWVITHVNLENLGRLDHGRTIQNFPIGDILPSLEIHKERFTKDTLQPRLEGFTQTMVDDDERIATPKTGLKVIHIETPEEIVERESIKVQTQGDKHVMEDEGWEA
jgi:hypothetical protein